ncbi:MAG TPA: serine/threonine-protein kinase [Gemmatimonadales bacterium]
MPSPLDAAREALADRYAIEAELGQGGMATVYRATDLRHQRAVALKVLSPEQWRGTSPARFLREIQIVATLSHPHILPMFDSGEAGGHLYYAMPLAEEGSLRARLQRERQLPLDDAIQINREVADALSFAHSHGIVHRDVKPENILFHGGHAVVADFGIARLFASLGEQSITGTGTVVGSPAYMSPEQAAGDVQLDARSDVYSLACVLYEMLGGEPPHTGPTPQAILARQLSGEVRSLRPLRSSVHPALDAVIRRGLAPAPADRFASAYEFATAASTTATGASAPAAAAHGGWRRRLRAARIPILAAALGVVAWVAVRSLAARSSDRRLGVAVFPFRVAGAPDQLTETLPDLLTTALDGTPDVRVADPWSLWQHLRPTRAELAQSPDPVDAARLAQKAGAARYVLGAVNQNGSRVDVTLRLYGLQTVEPLQTLAVTGSADSLPALVQRSAVAIIAALGGRPGRPMETYATQSVDAVKAYLSAREAMRRGLVDSADVAIDRALALDSNFALALVDAVGIKSWKQFNVGQPYQGMIALAERAVRVSDSLSERERMRARAVLASLLTDGPGVAEALDRILEQDSTDLRALDLLSYSHLVYGWQYGVGEVEARAVAERVLQLDPGYAPALARRAYLATAVEDTADIRRQIDRLQHADTTNSLVRGSLLSLRAIDADPDRFQRLLDTIVAAPLTEWLFVLRILRAYDPPRAERLLQRLRASAGPGFPRRAAIGGDVQLALAEGRLRQVDSAAHAGALRAFPGLEQTADLFLVASAIVGVGDSAVTTRALATLTAYVPVDSAAAYFQTRPVWWTGWVLGAYHASFGDTAVTARWRAAIGRLPGGGTSKDWRGAIQADFDSRLAARAGDLPRALMLAERAYDLWTIHSNTTYEAQPEPAMRLQMALLLRATGRPDSAAVLLRSLVPPTTWMGFVTARASLELGELAEARGDRMAAARYYAMALALWRRGGAEVAPWRDRAAGGLRRVVGETGA